jgi:hypothetical protein
MGLGIHKDGSMVVYELPLVGNEDHKWDDNTWICEHLRQLADKIETTDFQIISIGMQTKNLGYVTYPEIVVQGYEQKNKSYKE